MPPFPRSARAVALVALLAATGCSSAAQVSSGGGAGPFAPIAEVVSFGDSWTDAGTFGSVFGTAEGGSWAQLLAGKYGAGQEPNRRIEHADSFTGRSGSRPPVFGRSACICGLPQPTLLSGVNRPNPGRRHRRALIAKATEERDGQQDVEPRR